MLNICKRVYFSYSRRLSSSKFTKNITHPLKVFFKWIVKILIAPIICLDLYVWRLHLFVLIWFMFFDKYQGIAEQMCWSMIVKGILNLNVVLSPSVLTKMCNLKFVNSRHASFISSKKNSGKRTLRNNFSFPLLCKRNGAAACASNF